MSLIRMLGCCCETGGPGGPGTGSRLCDVVAWCYSNEKTEPYLTSWSQTGTKPRAPGTNNRQMTDWVSEITGVTVVNKTYLGDSPPGSAFPLKNRFSFELEIDYNLEYTGTSGSTDCGCKRAGVWEEYDTTSGSATTTTTVIVGCQVTGSQVDTIIVNATATGFPAGITFCDPPVQNTAAVKVDVAGGAQSYPGPFPATGMDTCAELRTKTMAYQCRVGGVNTGCNEEAEDANLHQITFNFGYA